jgi:hypothetical protein
MLDPFLVVITVIMSAQKNVGPFFSNDHSDHSDHECSSVLMSSYRSCTFFATDHSDHRDHECSSVLMSSYRSCTFFTTDQSDHRDHECSEKLDLFLVVITVIMSAQKNCWTLF